MGFVALIESNCGIRAGLRLKRIIISERKTGLPTEHEERNSLKPIF